MTPHPTAPFPATVTTLARCRTLRIHLCACPALQRHPILSHAPRHWPQPILPQRVAVPMATSSAVPCISFAWPNTHFVITSTVPTSTATCGPVCRLWCRHPPCLPRRLLLPRPQRSLQTFPVQHTRRKSIKGYPDNANTCPVGGTLAMSQRKSTTARHSSRALHSPATAALASPR